MVTAAYNLPKLSDRFQPVTFREVIALSRRRRIVAEETRGKLLVLRFADGTEIAVESRIYDGPYCPDFAGLSLDAPLCHARKV